VVPRSSQNKPALPAFGASPGHEPFFGWRGENVLGNGKATVKSNFTICGNSTYISASHGATPVMGTYIAIARSEVSYASVDNAWLISNETWNFLTLDFKG
jgi:hypothetical protein